MSSFSWFSSSFWVGFPSCLASLATFDWLPGIAKLTLLSPGYFWIPTVLWGFSSSVWLIYLGAICSFWVLVLSFLRQDRTAFRSGTNFIWLLKLFVYSSQCPVNFEGFNVFFLSDWWGIGTILNLCELWNCSFQFLWVIFSPACGNFLTHMNWPKLLWIKQRGPW